MNYNLFTYLAQYQDQYSLADMRAVCIKEGYLDFEIAAEYIRVNVGKMKNSDIIIKLREAGYSDAQIKYAYTNYKKESEQIVKPAWKMGRFMIVAVIILIFLATIYGVSSKTTTGAFISNKLLGNECLKITEVSDGTNYFVAKGCEMEKFFGQLLHNDKLKAEFINANGGL